MLCELAGVVAEGEVGRGVAALDAHDSGVIRSRRVRLFVEQPEVDVLVSGNADPGLEPACTSHCFGEGGRLATGTGSGLRSQLPSARALAATSDGARVGAGVAVVGACGHELRRGL